MYGLTVISVLKHDMYISCQQDFFLPSFCRYGMGHLHLGRLTPRCANTFLHTYFYKKHSWPAQILDTFELHLMIWNMNMVQMEPPLCTWRVISKDQTKRGHTMRARLLPARCADRLIKKKNRKGRLTFFQHPLSTSCQAFDLLIMLFKAFFKPWLNPSKRKNVQAVC